MTKSGVELLAANMDKVVRVRCRDREVFVAKIVSVSEEEPDLIETSRESQYEKADRQPAYLIRFDD
jgi:hypothetical protein